MSADANETTGQVQLHIETGERDVIPARPIRISNYWVSWIWEHFHCIRWKASMLLEFIRNFDLCKLAGVLRWVCWETLYALFMVFPVQQLFAQSVLLENPLSFNALSILFYLFCVLDRLILLYVGTVEGPQTAMQFNILGMEAISKNNKVQMGNCTKLVLLILGIVVGVVGMTLYPALNIIIGGTEHLNNTASADHFDLTMKTSLNGALPLPELIWSILELVSQCLNYISLVISMSTSVLLHFDFIQKTENPAIEQQGGFIKLLMSYDRITKGFRIFAIIYYCGLWGYDRVLAKFPGIQNVVGIVNVQKGLAFVSLLLTWGYIEYSKYVETTATKGGWIAFRGFVIFKLTNGWGALRGFVTSKR